MKQTISELEQLWLDGMKDENGRLPKRIEDDEEEEQFWRRHLEKKRRGEHVDEYAKEMTKALLTYIEEGDTVLEIGPGWGNYTFALAEKAAALTCVDSSKSCLQFLQRLNQEKQLPLTYVQAKWEDYQPESHDVMIGVNCFYRIKEIRRALERMNAHAKKRAIIGMTTAPMRPHYLDLQAAYGYQLKYPRRDYIHLVHLLYEMGIYASCNIVPLTKTYRFASEEALLKDNSSRLLAADVDEDVIRQSLAPYVRKKDGVFLYEHQFYGALIDWEPVPLTRK